MSQLFSRERGGASDPKVPDLYYYPSTTQVGSALKLHATVIFFSGSRLLCLIGQVIKLTPRSGTQIVDKLELCNYKVFLSDSYKSSLVKYELFWQIQSSCFWPSLNARKGCFQINNCCAFFLLLGTSNFFAKKLSTTVKEREKDKTKPFQQAMFPSTIIEVISNETNLHCSIK